MNIFNGAGSLPIHTFPSQISIVDIFLPGFTAISASIRQVLAGNLNSAHLLCLCGALLLLARYVYRYLTDIVEIHFTSITNVLYYDEAHDMLKTWVSDQPFARKARSSIVSVGYADDHSNAHAKNPLRFSPYNGSFFFWYGNHLLRLRCEQKDSSSGEREEVSVSCFGRSPEILREFFSDCRTEYLKAIQKKTSVFEHRDGENFRHYANWRLSQFNVTKQSTIWVEWKFLRLLYKRVAGKKMDEIVGEQVSEFILGPLTDEYSLDLSVECKPTLSVEDLLSVLHYHWCLDTSAVPHERYTVQLPLLMLMAPTRLLVQERSSRAAAFGAPTTLCGTGTWCSVSSPIRRNQGVTFWSWR
ncbi:hypothetical protein RJZ56_007693 [Blastomyces dermatitidis]|uniref:BCS1 N-terminal domain-containing protein n=1 Tax=Ajellomyces dermatitidis (strain ER-3 / ATCC MYA-2586) TaxID=559297 RepID=A0ABP2ESP4_AJEDR|nr:uncharacterized protein BDCG_01913 [Blastomyces dermatitidis ER-3]EEQ86793.2 hypothetical protein BDCG_01913 [Blastomyces dermatitidis ER-3]